MPLAKCARCKKPFQKLRSPVCPACLDAEDADYDKVKQVLEREPNLNAEQVAEKAEVEIACIWRMLDQGLIASESTIAGTVRCGRCGAPAISAGKKLCEACLNKLNAEAVAAQANLRSKKKTPQVSGEPVSARAAIEKKRRK